jgi:hypothetical protein
MYHVSPTIYLVNLIWRSLEMHGYRRFGRESTLGIGNSCGGFGCG